MRKGVPVALAIALTITSAIPAFAGWKEDLKTKLAAAYPPSVTFVVSVKGLIGDPGRRIPVRGLYQGKLIDTFGGASDNTKAEPLPLGTKVKVVSVQVENVRVILILQALDGKRPLKTAIAISYMSQNDLMFAELADIKEQIGVAIKPVLELSVPGGGF